MRLDRLVLREIFGVLMTASAVEKPKRSRKQTIDEPTK